MHETTTLQRPNEKEKHSKRIYVRETQSVKKKKKTDGESVYKQLLINAKLKTGKRGQKNRAEWEKSIRQAKVRIGP